MAKYNVTHTCGHAERVDLVGHHTSREWRIQQLEQRECFECRKQAELKAAQAEAQQQELPPLQGTEKQITWAETIRAEKLRMLNAEIVRMTEAIDSELLQAIDHITHEVSAHRWIEWRDETIRSMIRQVITASKADTISLPQQDTVKNDALLEATVRPEKPVTETIAEIHVKGNVIEIFFPEKREDFRELVRFQLDFAWLDNRWKRTIIGRNGTVEDRASETGHALLASGFPIRIFQESIRQKAIAGDFTPECTRWITTIIAGDYTGWFAVLWGKREDYYSVAKRLKRSRYAPPCVIVPPEQFEEVLDFAQVHGFCVSEKAREIAAQAKELRDATLTVKVERLSKLKKQTVTDKPAHLEVPENIEILEEFKEAI